MVAALTTALVVGQGMVRATIARATVLAVMATGSSACARAPHVDPQPVAVTEAATSARPAELVDGGLELDLTRVFE